MKSDIETGAPARAQRLDYTLPHGAASEILALESLLDRIPHRPPARLVERVLRADAASAVAALLVREGPWLRRGALAPEALVEALAQTCALHGAANAEPGSPPRGGALAAVSRFVFPSAAVPGEEVVLTVQLETRLGPLVAFAGVARVGEREVARGELRVVVLPAAAP